MVKINAKKLGRLMRVIASGMERGSSEEVAAGHMLVRSAMGSPAVSCVVGVSDQDEADMILLDLYSSESACSASLARMYVTALNACRSLPGGRVAVSLCGGPGFVIASIHGGDSPPPPCYSLNLPPSIKDAFQIAHQTAMELMRSIDSPPDADKNRAIDEIMRETVMGTEWMVVDVRTGADMFWPMVYRFRRGGWGGEKSESN